MVKMKEFKLKNGVRGVLIPLKGLRGVTVKVLVKMGSKYEKPGEFGMSHFLEHMAFKETGKRPRPGDVASEIDALGANYNASTDEEVTSYYVTTVREHVNWAVEILADVLFEAMFKKAEVEKERGVIVEELRMYDDNPMMGLAGDFAQFVYGKSPIGCFDIGGEVKDVVSISRKKLLGYRNRYFDPVQMVVIIAGDVGIGVMSSLERNFSDFKKKGKGVLPKVKLVVNDEKEKVKRKDIKQGHFCLGVPGLAWTDKRRYGLRFLEIILAGNSSSRLFRKIREERGWAYYVTSAGQMYKEGGLVAVQSGVRQEKLDEAMDLVVEEMVGLKDSIRQKELVAAREYVLGRTKLLMDRTGFWTNFVGRKMLLEGKRVTVEEEIDRYKKVRLGELKELAGELLVKDEMRRIIVRKRSRKR